MKLTFIICGRSTCPALAATGRGPLYPFCGEVSGDPKALGFKIDCFLAFVSACSSARLHTSKAFLMSPDSVDIFPAR